MYLQFFIGSMSDGIETNGEGFVAGKSTSMEIEWLVKAVLSL
jgi:hypothetical protein